MERLQCLMRRMNRAIPMLEAMEVLEKRMYCFHVRLISQVPTINFLYRFNMVLEALGKVAIRWCCNSKPLRVIMFPFGNRPILF